MEHSAHPCPRVHISWYWKINNRGPIWAAWAMQWGGAARTRKAAEVSSTACWLCSWLGSACQDTHWNTKDCGEGNTVKVYLLLFLSHTTWEPAGRLYQYATTERNGFWVFWQIMAVVPLGSKLWFWTVSLMPMNLSLRENLVVRCLHARLGEYHMEQCLLWEGRDF